VFELSSPPQPHHDLVRIVHRNHSHNANYRLTVSPSRWGKHMARNCLTHFTKHLCRHAFGLFTKALGICIKWCPFAPFESSLHAPRSVHQRGAGVGGATKVALADPDPDVIKEIGIVIPHALWSTMQPLAAFFAHLSALVSSVPAAAQQLCRTSFIAEPVRLNALTANSAE